MDTIFTTLRVAASLALIIGLIWFVQRKSAKWTRGRSQRPITVIGTKSLGGKSRVVIVEADGTHFVLGVSDSSVVVLKSREVSTFADAVAAEGEADFGTGGPGAGTETIEAVPALVRPPHSTARGRRAARPGFTASITSAETWKKAAQSARPNR